MRQSGKSHKQSIDSNLQQWCYEVDSEFQEANNNAAEEMAAYMNQHGLKEVVELGCGDGAAVRKFAELGIEISGVDINSEKLAMIDKSIPTHKSDMVTWMSAQDSVPSIFMHHSLEHIVSVEKLLALVTQKLRPGCIFYCVVPAGDHPHEVHHTAFDDASELMPPGLEVLHLGKQERFGHEEFKCVAIKS